MMKHLRVDVIRHKDLIKHEARLLGGVVSSDTLGADVVAVLQRTILDNRGVRTVDDFEVGDERYSYKLHMLSRW